MVKEIPFWNGEDLCDKTIIINPEREIDVIMFARFVIEISKKSKQVIFRCFENLYKLMKTNMPSNVKVVKMRDNVAADFQVMILSIPYFLKTTSENLPTFHIKPNVKEMEKTKYLFDGKVNKIGFCFSKGGEGSIRSINEIEKKQAFEMAYKQAFDSDKYSFFSLNHEEISSKNITDLSNFIYEYDKLASVISHLDLLISFDNSVAHIASSMNKETWILTKKMSGWRLVENNKKDGCLWYPNTKIIKIDDNTSIESVFDKINYMIEKKFQ
ncbi:MAG: hypothetical protein BWY78_01233 [Alphaproteobacteria bacterium ADurb.Bin438]|nr:MAG: hypothetical protein BWY78_01233 [Alphaproteobacteria bacterium ADurb.Bin438]